MARQKSQQTSRKVPSRRRTGTLFIVGTPIGSSDDLTIRARNILSRVAIVAAETPLVTQALLNYHGIAATITGYERGEDKKIAILLDRLNTGQDIALVSDSGMPVIYDPGRLLITAARAAGHSVTVIPGPSALTAAAALSGYDADRLLFIGRLPRSAPQLDRLFRKLSSEPGTTVMFAQSSALPRILGRLRRILPGRSLTLAMDMTKPDEAVWQGRADVLLNETGSLPKDAEVTLVLSGPGKR